VVCNTDGQSFLLFLGVLPSWIHVGIFKQGTSYHLLGKKKLYSWPTLTFLPSPLTYLARNNPAHSSSFPSVSDGCLLPSLCGQAHLRAHSILHRGAAWCRMSGHLLTASRMASFPLFLQTHSSCSPPKNIHSPQHVPIPLFFSLSLKILEGGKSLLYHQSQKIHSEWLQSWLIKTWVFMGKEDWEVDREEVTCSSLTDKMLDI
jgi:hypothetical protein